MRPAHQDDRCPSLPGAARTAPFTYGANVACSLGSTYKIKEVAGALRPAVKLGRVSDSRVPLIVTDGSTNLS